MTWYWHPGESTEKPNGAPLSGLTTAFSGLRFAHPLVPHDDGTHTMIGGGQTMNTDHCYKLTNTALALLLVLLVVALPVWAGDQEDYEAARAANSIEAWESYLTSHPTGEHVSAAREAHDNLVWEAAIEIADDPRALEALFGRCKTPEGSDRVFRLWDDASWSASERAESLDAYRGYVYQFPRGKHVDEAKTLIEGIMWRSCLLSGTVDFYRAYLQEYPNGEHADRAKEAIGEEEPQATTVADDRHQVAEETSTDHAPEQAAVSGESEASFIDNSDGTVTDASTGLMWQQGGDGVARTRDEASSYCEQLQLGGHRDWRLPTCAALATLTDTTRADPAIDIRYFPDTSSSFYWASDLWGYFGHHKLHCAVDFATGFSEGFYETTNPRTADGRPKCARCVRDAED